jgi:hypothetical protein
MDPAKLLCSQPQVEMRNPDGSPRVTICYLVDPHRNTVVMACGFIEEPVS